MGALLDNRTARPTQTSSQVLSCCTIVITEREPKPGRTSLNTSKCSTIVSVGTRLWATEAPSSLSSYVNRMLTDPPLKGGKPIGKVLVEVNVARLSASLTVCRPASCSVYCSIQLFTTQERERTGSTRELKLTPCLQLERQQTVMDEGIQGSSYLRFPAQAHRRSIPRVEL
jgi:hypothetical protein